MKTTNKASTLGKGLATLTAALVILCAFGQACAVADTDTLGPLDIQLSLVGGTRFSLGEPISLRYDVNNSSKEDLVAHVGFDGASGGMRWLTIRLTGTDGKAVLPLPEVGPSERNGQQNDVVLVSAGRTQHGYVVLSQRFVLPSAGDYSLVVSARMPYDVEEPPFDNVPGQEAAVEVPPAYLASKTFSFPLHVAPADPRKLQALAESLRQEATAEHDVSKRSMLIRSLFSLPEAQAAASWRTIASDPRLSYWGADDIAHGLAQVRSAQAADILAGMFPTAQEAADPNVIVNFGSRDLEDMYRAGSAPLRQHISHLYAIHGVVFPAKPTPQVIPPGHVAVGRPTAQ